MSQSPATTLSNALTDALQDKLRQIYGATAHIIGVRPISRRAAVSARVELSGDNTPHFVFIKHVFPECYPAGNLAEEHIELAEEMLAQRFLDSCPSAQPFHPKLIAFDESGFLVLEYLCDHGFTQPRTFGYLTPR